MGELLQQFQKLLERLLAAHSVEERQSALEAIEQFLSQHKDALTSELAAISPSHVIAQLLHQLTSYALLENLLDEITTVDRKKSEPKRRAAEDVDAFSIVDEPALPPAPAASPPDFNVGAAAPQEAEEAEPDAPAEEEVLRAAVPRMESESTSDQVYFTAYYPRDVAAERRYALVAYAHLEHLRDLIARDVEKFRDELGGEVPQPRQARQSAAIKIGTPLTLMIECDDIVFDPQQLTRRWDGQWVRYLFDFTAPSSLIGELVTGAVVAMVSGVEVARVKFAFEIAPAEAESGGGVAAGLNPLAAAKIELEQTASPMYQRIFISYSRKDSKVALVYRAAQEALGNEVFMDSYSIRSGENWRAALARAIDEADVLQLFWSPNSAQSKNVRDEWDYALNYRCQPTRCAGFIRPVYWDKPLHPPPPELAHLNFRYVPIDDIIEGTPPD